MQVWDTALLDRRGQKRHAFNVIRRWSRSRR
jgi:hypothetical protein